MENYRIGELGTPAFSDRELEEMARKLEAGNPVPDIGAATAQMAAEPVLLQSTEAGTAGEVETQEALVEARNIIDMPEPTVVGVREVATAGTENVKETENAPVWETQFRAILNYDDPGDRKRQLSVLMATYGKGMTSEQLNEIVTESNKANAELKKDTLERDKKNRKELTPAEHLSEAKKEFQNIHETKYPNQREKLNALRLILKQHPNVLLDPEFQDLFNDEFTQTQTESFKPQNLKIPDPNGELIGRTEGSVDYKKKEAELWFKWGREQLAEYLDISKVEVLQQTKGNHVFQYDQINPVTNKPYDDVLAFMPEAVKVKLTEELKMVFEIRKIYFDWAEAHKKLGNLESGKGLLPSNDHLAKILNKLCGDDEFEDKEGKTGSHNVAIAIRLYYQMATEGTKSVLSTWKKRGKNFTKNGVHIHADDDGICWLIDNTGKQIEEGDKRVRVDGDGNRLVEDLEGKVLFEIGTGTEKVMVHNIFNTLLSDKEAAADRDKIAELCGGYYYENLGLVLAKFMGFAARGYDNTVAAVNDSDALGRLLWSKKICSWADQDEFEEKSDYIWLPKEISNYFLQINEKTGEYLMVNGKTVSIEAVVEMTTLSKGHFARVGQSDEVILVKAETAEQKRTRKAKAEAGEGVLKDYVLNDELDKIDWKESNYGPLGMMRFFQGRSMDLYNMFGELIKDKEIQLTGSAFGSKKGIITESLLHCAPKTRGHVAYLYMFSLLTRHGWDYLLKEKEPEAARGRWLAVKNAEVVKIAKESGFISAESAQKLRKEFNF